MILTKVPGLDNAGRAAAHAPRRAVRPLAATATATRPSLVLDARTGRAPADLGRARLQRDHRRRPPAARSIRRATSARGTATSSSCARCGARTARPSRPRRASPRCATARCAPRATTAIFRTLRRAGVARDAAASSWPGTSRSPASARSAAGCCTSATTPSRASATRNLADLKVQGRAPAFRITSVTDFTPEQNPYLARRVDGEFTVPCYLDQPGLPARARASTTRGPATSCPTAIPGNVMTAPFRCNVPRSATPDRPGAPVALRARPARQLHRGQRRQRPGSWPTSTTSCSARPGGPACPTRTSPTRSPSCRTSAGCPTIADRLQQGMLNFLYLGRLMIHPRGPRDLDRAARRRRPAARRHEPPLLRRQQPGRDHGRRADAVRARLHPRRARRARA